MVTVGDGSMRSFAGNRENILNLSLTDAGGDPNPCPAASQMATVRLFTRLIIRCRTADMAYRQTVYLTSSASQTGSVSDRRDSINRSFQPFFSQAIGQAIVLSPRAWPWRRCRVRSWPRRSNRPPCGQSSAPNRISRQRHANRVRGSRQPLATAFTLSLVFLFTCHQCAIRIV